jgi:hypothetical protein
MAHLCSNCPICNTTIQDYSKEECERCGWILKIGDLLDPKIHNLLLDWGIHYYDKARELESRGKYRQDLLNNRLNSQRDDINLLQKQIESILAHLPEIKSILRSKEINIDTEDIYPITVVSSVEDKDRYSIIEEQNPANIDTYNSRHIVRDNINKPKDEEEIIVQTDELSQTQKEIVSEYYNNPGQFADKYQVKIANLTKDSINSNRANEEKTIVLEESNRGNYWVFTSNECIYLVPVEGKYINQHSYVTTSAIFEGNNYTPDYQKIQLIRPAILIIDTSGNPQTWRLKEQGKLVFS